MIRSLKYIVLGVLLIAIVAPCHAKEYPERWVFVSHSPRSDEEVATIERIVQTGSEHGLNGMVLSAGLDRLEQQSPAFLERLAKVKEFCQARGVEIIPNIFSAGYGGSVLAYNRNLAAGIPVRDAPFLVKGGAGVPESGPTGPRRQRRIRAVQRESIPGLPIP